MNGDRVRFITHRGQRILLVEYDGCTAAQFSTICDLVPSYVTAEPKGSVLLLADFTNAQMDREGLEHLKKATVFDRPHLKRSAWVVTNGFPKVFSDNVKAFSVCDLPSFITREQALSYLIEEDEDETRVLASQA